MMKKNVHKYTYVKCKIDQVIKYKFNYCTLVIKI